LRPVTKKNGEWSKEERKLRTKIFPNGEKIFEDVGMQFYFVEKGDAISGIREKLSAYPQYAYLSDQRSKLNSFNIPETKLQVNMWIPIPIDAKDRKVTEAQFVAYANKALDEMMHNEEYGDVVQEIVRKVGRRELLATVIAVAKQEGGGLPIGQFALHRYEPHKKAFSYSHFHVLMEHAGLRARRGLNLTEGQTYHPVNGVKLFLAFLAEKHSNPHKLFPVTSETEGERFAVFYDGSHWKDLDKNPNYLNDLRTYRADADIHLSEDGAHWKRDEVLGKEDTG